MQKITLKDAINSAIRAEELGINFYSELSRKFSKNAEMKRMFELLAKDEVEHKRQFNELLKNVSEAYNQIDTKDEDYLKSVDISRFFEGMETIDDKIKPLATLTRAFAFEKETILFYIGLKDIIGKSPILDEIIKIEKSHVAKLMQYVMTDGSFRGIIDNWK